ncbi:M48 family metallopeptidase [Clostridium rectalis]|uniref:M48 family metallopeptidase n=1 Tax=Clostridium rectalis TaxID=2040295 RepID=UPI000F62F453|nr:M48 family metallopeptidase [Clostridium rectalis]
MISKILFLGIYYSVEILFYVETKVKIFIRGKKIEIYMPKKWCGNIQYNKIVIDNIYIWYRKLARELIGEKLKLYSEIVGVKYNNYRIKEQKTRLGSCSSKKNLNFNWRIILAPEWIMDYIIIHELCHIKQMNHSKLFWKEVEKYMSEYNEAIFWIKNNINTLYIEFL